LELAGNIQKKRELIRFPKPQRCAAMAEQMVMPELEWRWSYLFA
jgi:hypothetical protein